MVLLSYLFWKSLIVFSYRSLQRRAGEVVLHANIGGTGVRCHELKERLIVFSAALQAKVENCLLRFLRQLLV